ncbi:hypothetical protein JK636_11460 [Clostridium sp. YIM B02515]|jgi:hypothetical protein|uniref:Uncharacterized protein n=1 Tax=Clostridium rhizosphaerae TaxID=2803861 RepID=A0ABS1TDF9_9CLOT|nr:hypothetical protein [Clostridium rhizosphaerae]MBL4936379.1 hypothetical protein [Clostridium rhizosphaerae]
MQEEKLKLLQKDIDEALETIENMEDGLKNEGLSTDVVKEKFLYLSQKLEELETILKSEGIL